MVAIFPFFELSFCSDTIVFLSSEFAIAIFLKSIEVSFPYFYSFANPGESSGKEFCESKLLSFSAIKVFRSICPNKLSIP